MVEVGLLVVEVLLSTTQTSSWTRFFFNNPSYFLFQGVVHVGVNYRLGALGFLALEGEVGGNQGLRDQVSEA